MSRVLKNRYGGIRPAGGDARYEYIHFSDLHPHDKSSIKSSRYPHGVEHLPDEEYLYPIKANGRLADARRHMPHKKAKRLYEEHIAKHTEPT